MQSTDLSLPHNKCQGSPPSDRANKDLQVVSICSSSCRLCSAMTRMEHVARVFGRVQQSQACLASTIPLVSLTISFSGLLAPTTNKQLKLPGQAPDSALKMGEPESTKQGVNELTTTSSHKYQKPAYSDTQKQCPDFRLPTHSSIYNCSQGTIHSMCGLRDLQCSFAIGYSL